MLKKTKMTIFDVQDVTEVRVALCAQKLQKILHFLDNRPGEYASPFKEANPNNLIIKYDYVIKQNEHTIFIAPLLVDDAYTCYLLSSNRYHFTDSWVGMWILRP